MEEEVCGPRRSGKNAVCTRCSMLCEESEWGASCTRSGQGWFAVCVEDVVLLRDMHMNRNKVDAKKMMGFILPR